jgi:hypothetical protein
VVKNTALPLSGEGCIFVMIELVIIKNSFNPLMHGKKFKKN